MTKKQQVKAAIFNFIVAFLAEHGYSPTLDQIASAVGQKSKGTISQYVNELIASGHLERPTDRPTGVLIVKKPFVVEEGGGDNDDGMGD